MKLPQSVRGVSRERSLDTLEYDYQQFMASGGDIRKAKDYHNVIGPYFFQVPLDQVKTIRYEN